MFSGVMMIKIVLLSFCIILLGLFAVNITAQEQTKQPEKKNKVEQNEKGEKISPPVLNSVKLIYQPGHVYHYTYIDSTKVLRTYSDSSRLEYTRYIKYYLKQRAYKEAKSGDLEVETNIDSTDYKFTSGEYTLEYNSKNRKMQLQFPDLLASIHPENRTFVTRYSSNWEVSDIFSPDLEYWRDYVVKYGEGQDTMVKFIFLNALSLTNLAQIADFQKGALPNGRVAKDSVWIKPYTMKIDGIDCKDNEAKSHIVSVDSKETVVETTLSTISATPQTMRLYNINLFANILGAMGSGKQTLHITRRGVCTESKSTFDVVLKAQVNKEVFTEKVKSGYTWTFISEYEY